MKKILSICLSILMVFLILPAREVNADPTTWYADELTEGDLLQEGDILKYTRLYDEWFGVYDASSMFGPFEEPPTPVQSYTLDKNYIFIECDYDDGYYIVLSPYVTVEFYNGLTLHDTKYCSIYDSVGVDDMNQIYLATDGEVKYSYMPMTPLGSSFCWTWESDKNAGQPKTFSYYGEEGSSALLLKDLYNSNSLVKIKFELYTPALADFKVLGKSTVITETTNTYIISMLDQFGYVINGTGRTLLITKLDPTTGNPIGDPAEEITFDDGFSFTTTAPATAGDVVYQVTIKDPESGEESVKKAFVIHVEEAEVINDLENGAWPWGTTITKDKATLKTGLKISNFDVEPTYQWQSSENNYSFDNIISATSQTYEVTTANDGKWYRCKVTYTPQGGSETTLYTKGVQVIDDVHIQMSGDGITDGFSYGYEGRFYVSNGKGAYTVDKDNGKFNVLGLWNDLWVHTSFDPNWSIYMKETDTDPKTPTPIDLGNIKDIYPRFVDYNGSEVIFDVRFIGACDAAIYTDVCIGSKWQFGDYTDYAAVKANLQGNELGNVQLFAKGDFQSGTSDTCTFVMTPVLSSVHTGNNLPNVSTFTVDSFNNTDEDNDWYYECDDNADTYGVDYDYDDMVGYQGFGIFDYNKEIRPDFYYYDCDPRSMYYQNIGGKNMCLSIYEEDSILAMSWSNVTEISYMFGIGKAGELQGVTFTDIKNPEETEEEHGGSSWVEIPNTSAYIR